MKINHAPYRKTAMGYDWFLEFIFLSVFQIFFKYFSENACKKLDYRAK